MYIFDLINDVAIERGEVVKNWSKLSTDSIKKTSHRGKGGVKNLEKNDDVFYGWSFSRIIPCFKRK